MNARPIGKSTTAATALFLRWYGTGLPCRRDDRKPSCRQCRVGVFSNVEANLYEAKFFSSAH
jgi:hypothetical protein